MLIPLIIGVCLVRPTPISSFTIEVQMDRIEQIGGEHLLDLSGIRVRKYNRTLSVINGTYSIVRDLDDSLEVSRIACGISVPNLKIYTVHGYRGPECPRE